MKPTICTYSGIEFAPLSPTVETVRVRDIAHALACMPRFAGHTRMHLSVAQHSVRVSQLCDPDEAGYGLMHDASEAYLMDMPRPIKRLFPGYVEAEERLLRVIYQAVGLDPDRLKPPSVKRADDDILLAEQRDLMPDTHWWSKSDVPHVAPVFPVSSVEAERMFIFRFFELQKAGWFKGIEV